MKIVRKFRTIKNRHNSKTTAKWKFLRRSVLAGQSAERFARRILYRRCVVNILSTGVPGNLPKTVLMIPTSTSSAKKQRSIVFVCTLYAILTPHEPSRQVCSRRCFKNYWDTPVSRLQWTVMFMSQPILWIMQSNCSSKMEYADRTPFRINQKWRKMVSTKNASGWIVHESTEFVEKNGQILSAKRGFRTKHHKNLCKNGVEPLPTTQKPLQIKDFLRRYIHMKLGIESQVPFSRCWYISV